MQRYQKCTIVLDDKLLTEPLESGPGMLVCVNDQCAIPRIGSAEIALSKLGRTVSRAGNSREGKMKVSYHKHPSILYSD